MSKEACRIADLPWFKFYGHNYFPYVSAASNENAGLVLKAVCSYLSGTPAQELSLPDPLSQAIFNAIRQDVDRSYDSYVRQVEGGKKGGRPPKKTHPYPAEPCQTEEEPEEEKEKEIEEESEPEGEEEEETETDPQSSPVRSDDRGYGRHGCVKLTRMEYVRLCGELGEDEVNRCISRLDESAQSAGTNNGWQDWEMLVRRCSRNRRTPSAQPDSDRSVSLGDHSAFAAADPNTAQRSFLCP